MKSKEEILKMTKDERVGKRISLAEACRMADELQARIDAEYDKELERDAKIRAVWA